MYNAFMAYFIAVMGKKQASAAPSEEPESPSGSTSLAVPERGLAKTNEVKLGDDPIADIATAAEMYLFPEASNAQPAKIRAITNYFLKQTGMSGLRKDLAKGLKLFFETASEEQLEKIGKIVYNKLHKVRFSYGPKFEGIEDLFPLKKKVSENDLEEQLIRQLEPIIERMFLRV